MAAELLTKLLEDALWSGLAALGFAMLFNVPRRALIYCVLLGAMGHAFRILIVQQGGLSIEAGTLAGATLVGFISKYLAQRLQMPMLIFAVCGAIPMVPGTFAYNAMIALLRVSASDVQTENVLLVEAGINGVKTALILGALAFGIAAPTLLFQRNRPMPQNHETR